MNLNEHSTPSYSESKEKAIAFYRMAYDGNPRHAMDLNVGKNYIQHNPLVSNGKEPFIKYFDRMQAEYPDKSIEFIRVIAEGNIVALHTHQKWPDHMECAIMDFFRFSNKGKIIEHCDAIQDKQKSSESENTMY